MATTTTAKAPGGPQSTAPETSVPIDALDTPAAKSYTHLHAALILSAYTLRFKATVADPITSLASLLLPVSALQLAYAIICLPPTGSGSSTPAPAPKTWVKRKADAKKQHAEVGIGGKIVPALLSLIISAAVGTPLMFVVMVLFGAPVTTHHMDTLLAAAHLSLLSSIPLVYVHGVSGETWRQIASLMVPVDEVLGASLGACLGAWLGAVPIPLDWDREWQKWPVTIVTGAYIGFVVGKTLGGLLFKGAKIKFD